MDPLEARVKALEILVAELDSRTSDLIRLGPNCVGCNTHLPLNEFVWEGTAERMGT